MKQEEVSITLQKKNLTFSNHSIALTGQEKHSLRQTRAEANLYFKENMPLQPQMHSTKKKAVKYKPNTELRLM